MTTGAWITSAAAVGLLTATLVFAWQRQLEHRHLLRTAKRDVYLSVLRATHRARNARFRNDRTQIAESYLELEALENEVIMFEYKLGSANEIRNGMREFRNALIPDGGVPNNLDSTRSSPSQFVTDAAFERDGQDAHWRLVLAMRADLDSTVRTSWLGAIGQWWRQFRDGTPPE